MKGTLTIVAILGLAFFGIAGFFGWKHYTRDEVRGVQLSLNLQYTDEQKEEVEKQFNELLDQESVLQPVIDEFNLIRYYKTSDAVQVLALLKEDTFCRLQGEESLQVLFKGPRNQRSLRENASRKIAERFVAALQAQGKK